MLSTYLAHVLVDFKTCGNPEPHRLNGCHMTAILKGSRLY